MANLKWGWMKEWTFSFPLDGDSRDFLRKMASVGQKKRLSIRSTRTETTLTVRVFPILPQGSRDKRHIEPWTFYYERDYPALAHYRTAKNHGFEAHINKTGKCYRVTIKNHAHQTDSPIPR